MRNKEIREKNSGALLSIYGKKEKREQILIHTFMLFSLFPKVFTYVISFGVHSYMPTLRKSLAES